MSYTIKNARGHVEVLDENGCFLFSADSEAEALSEIRDIEAA
ncbi:hypothetical protein AAFA46_08880 [Oscillospiraceae bacterium WX1]